MIDVINELLLLISIQLIYASGSLENERYNLASWVLAPHPITPGQRARGFCER